MIIIFNEREEHDLFNKLTYSGKRIDSFPPFNDAFYINSYRISTEITCDHVKDYIKKNFNLT